MGIVEVNFLAQRGEGECVANVLLEDLLDYQAKAVRLLNGDGEMVNVVVYDMRKLPSIMDKAVRLERKGIGSYGIFVNGKQVDKANFK